MAFRFFRRLKIAPGVSLNLSRSGVSPSIGVPGARVTLGRDGLRRTVGLPGTGLYYTEVDRHGGGGPDRSRDRGRGGRRRRAQHRDRRPTRTDPRPDPRPAPPPVPRQLDLGFFQRLFTPKAERDFVAGCKAHVTGDDQAAREAFARAADDHADAAFLAGFLALNADLTDDAVRHLERALARQRTLGRLFDKYGLSVELALPVTDLVVAHVRPGRRGALLGLVEAYQARGRLADARAALEKLHRDDPDDVLVRVSLAEMLLDGHGGGPRGRDTGRSAAPDDDDTPLDRRTARRLVELAGQVENASSTHAVLMLYKGRALRALGLATAARDVLTAALRRRKDRDPEVLRAVRKERARVYEDLGRKARARGEWERVFADDPSDPEAAARLGVT
jgi:tetratricopeptide (TPR) repeat protein